MRFGVLWIVLVFLTCGSTSANEPAKEQVEKRPNFLFILADDQAPFSLGAYGNTQCKTPNINALAKRGMRFDQAYHMGAFSGAVCRPSRHMIMTGRSVWHIPQAPSRNSVLNILDPSKSLDPTNTHIPEKLELNSLPAVFNRAGYATMRTCKIGNSYPAANKLFTVVKDKTRRGKTKDDGSAWHADQVLDYLKVREETQDEKPFLIYFGFSHPHDPRWANQKLLDKYGALNELEPGEWVNPTSPNLPFNYLDKHPFPHGHPGLRDEVAVQGVMTNRDELTIRNEKGREYACIENIDTQVGRVLAALKKSGELENTYVIYTADHGIAIGRHGYMGKQCLFEHCWRVPYIVAGPGVQQGNAKGNIYLLDTLATLCDLAGIDAPETNEGHSFRPVLEGKKDTVRDVMYGVYSGGTKPGMRAVRKGDWKLIKYETLDGKVKETQLFNLKENPQEFLVEHQASKIVNVTGFLPKPNQIDLAEVPEFESKRKEMEDLLYSEMEKHHDPYRFDEGFINPPKKEKKKKNNKKKKSQ